MVTAWRRMPQSCPGGAFSSLERVGVFESNLAIQCRAKQKRQAFPCSDVVALPNTSSSPMQSLASHAFAGGTPLSRPSRIDPRPSRAAMPSTLSTKPATAPELIQRLPWKEAALQTVTERETAGSEEPRMKCKDAGLAENSESCNEEKRKHSLHRSGLFGAWQSTGWSQVKPQILHAKLPRFPCHSPTVSLGNLEELPPVVAVASDAAHVYDGANFEEIPALKKIQTLDPEVQGGINLTTWDFIDSKF